MDKDKVKVILKEAIKNAFDNSELDDRDFCLGDETINLMTKSALNVLLAVEDAQDLLKKEGILK